MDSLLCGYLRFGKPLEKQSLLFVVDTEATTSGGVQTANPVHAFPRLSSGNLSTATLTIDWGDGTSTTIPKNTPYDNNYFTDYSTHTYEAPGKYIVTVEAYDFSSCSFGVNSNTSAAFSKLKLWRDTVISIGPEDAEEYSLPCMKSDFSYAFASCMKLTKVPFGLFKNNPAVTSFSFTFFECIGLTGTIPERLFANNPDVTSFDSTFRTCFGLSGSIPEGLFANNPAVTSFDSTFMQCRGLTAVPKALFEENINAVTFIETFCGCSGITSEVPELWISHPNATGTYCYIGCTDAANYADIPAHWR